MKAVRWALNPGELKTNVDRANAEVASVQTKLDVTRSRMLMGAGDDEAQEKLKKEVETLKQQMAIKELENKHLQDQMALVQTMLQMVKPASAPLVDFTHKMAELLTKVFGFIGSLFSGGDVSC